MARVKNPALFSKVFGIDPDQLDTLGIFDPVLNADTKLFIDPLLLKGSKNKLISKEGTARFDNYFGSVVKLIAASNEKGDAAWRGAEKFFNVPEPRGTCLGYGNLTTHGTGIGPGYRAKLLQTAKEIIELGIDNPEMFALMSLLEAGIGADRVSDLTTRAILPVLYKLNAELVETLGIPKKRTAEFTAGKETYRLAFNPFEEGESTPVILVPKDILRELPIASDWDSVGDAAAANAALRERVNERIAELWAKKSEEAKKELKAKALTSKVAFLTLMAAVGAVAKEPYDPNADDEGHYLWRSVLDTVAAQFPLKIAKPPKKDIKELAKVVDAIIAHFQKLIEENGEWYHLWHNDEPRHERAAQRLFYAVAEAYCKANDVGISPESDSGAGPVDFKFSTGFSGSILVELKLSTGKVVSGYKTQLEIYKKAENTTNARYVVIDVGGMGKKLDKIMEIRNERALAKEAVSPIIVIDGSRRESASKRKDKK